MFKYLLLLLAVVGFNSCRIDEDLSNCARPFMLKVKALDAEQNDITTSGQVKDILLFVFNENGSYVDLIKYDPDNKDGVRIYYPGHKNLKFISWANSLSDNEFNSLENIKKIEDLFVRLKSKDGIASESGDLFQGELEHKVEYGGVNYSAPKVLNITRRTCSVYIIAKMLKQWNDNRDGDYSFVLRSSKDEYDAYANLKGKTVSYKPKTEPLDAHHHCPIFKSYPLEGENTFTVEIYYNGELIFTADKDHLGKPFVPVIGKTCNIVIDFSGDPKIQVQIKPWGVIWQQVVF